MSERIIAQYLHDRRAGIVADRCLPTTTTVLAPTVNPTGQTGSNGVWMPPADTIASRLPAKRSRHHCRGEVVSQAENRSMVFESNLERDFSRILMSDRKVEHIHDQPPAVTYRTEDGKKHQHTFDFLVRERSGRRVAYAVKPLDLVKKSGIDTIVALIAAAPPRNFADAFEIRTELDVTKDAVFNAGTILRSRRGRNDGDVEKLRQLISSLNGSVGIRDLVAASRMGARGWNAVVCLIDDGVLKIVASSRIDERSRVRLVTPTEV